MSGSAAAPPAVPAPVTGLVLDTSALIAHLSPHDAHHADATALLNAHLSTPLGMSVVNVAEILVGYVRAGRLPVGEQMLSSLGIAEHPLPQQAASRLAQLRAATNLKMPDCCVVLAAQDAGYAVASFDDRLRREAEGLGLTVLPRPDLS